MADFVLPSQTDTPPSPSGGDGNSFALPSQTDEVTGASGSTEGLSPERIKGRQAAMKEGTLLDAVPRAITYGMMGNIPDYIGATASGVGNLLGEGGFKKSFNASLEQQQGEREGLAAKYPGTTLAGILGGSVVSAVPVAKAIGTVGALVPRLTKAAVAGAGIGAAQGFAGGYGIEDRLARAKEGAGYGAVLGPVGEGVASTVGPFVNKVLGIGARAAPGVDAAGRVAAAKEFGIDLTRGQATGNVGQQAYEQAALNEAKGPIAGAILRNAEKNQISAVEAAKNKIGTDIGGISADEASTGEGIGQGVKNTAADLRAQAEAQYGSAAGKPAWIDASDVTSLGQKVADTLHGEGIELDKYGNYPGSQAAMNLLRRVAGFEGAPKDGAVLAQSLQGLEQVRKGLLKVKGANAEDWRALSAIKSGFDDWLGNAIDSRLFRGDTSALDDLKSARQLWSRYKGITAGDKTDAARVVAKIANEDRTGNEVINFALNSSNAGQAGRTSRVLGRLKNVLGPTSDEWQSLRQAAWLRAANPAKGQGPQAISSSIMNFVTGTGNPVAKTLFSPDELATMQRFATVLRSTVPNPKATNPSKSGYEIARIFGQITSHGAPALAGLGISYETGNWNWMALAGLPIFRNATALARARSAIKALPSTNPGGTARAAGILAPVEYEKYKYQPGFASGGRAYSEYGELAKAISREPRLAQKAGGDLPIPLTQADLDAAAKEARQEGDKFKDAERAAEWYQLLPGSVAGPPLTSEMVPGYNVNDYGLRPPDYGFASGGATKPMYQDPLGGLPVVDDKMGIPNSPGAQQAGEGLGQAIASQLGRVGDVVMAPGRILSGEMTPDMPEYYKSAQDLAAMAMTGGMPIAKGSAVGAFGGRAPMEGPVRAATAVAEPPRSAVPAAGDRDTTIPGFDGWHGSPHDFPPTPGNPLGAFDNSKIGTGEGAQSFGYGHYIAEAKGVGKNYRDRLGGITTFPTLTPEENTYMRNFLGVDPTSNPDAIRRVATNVANSIDNMVNYSQSLIDAGQYHGDDLRIVQRELAGRRADADLLRRVSELPDEAMPKTQGKLYQARVNAPAEHFLDLDKPLSEQSAKVQEAFGKLGFTPLAPQADMLSRSFSAAIGEEPTPYAVTGKDLIEQMERKIGPQMTAERLKEAGLPGARYLDQNSRGAGDGSRNYVVFDDKTLDIIKKYGIAGLGIGTAAAAATTSPNKAEAKPAQKYGGAIRLPRSKSTLQSALRIARAH